MKTGFKYGLSVLVGLIFPFIAVANGLSDYAQEEQEDSEELVLPINIPVSLDKAGEILNERIRFTEPDAYYFRLKFYFHRNKQGDRERVRKLLGADHPAWKATDPGVPTPVLLQVSCTNGTVVDQKEIDPLLTSWGGDTFSKVIGFTRLLPGVYVIRLVLQQDAPAFDGTPVTFSIAGSPKSSFKSLPSDRRTTCPQ
ncbi:hypothetical protein AGMMS50256_31740 [Betaproteobacteria bacterium]|nr:hypothetical protein AGMMS50256_31740 [Betaproteobacteria bacterium]